MVDPRVDFGGPLLTPRFPQSIGISTFIRISISNPYRYPDFETFSQRGAAVWEVIREVRDLGELWQWMKEIMERGGLKIVECNGFLLG